MVLKNLTRSTKMKQVKKYTLKQFARKYEGQRHISCGLNYKDGYNMLIMNVSFSIIMYTIKKSGRELDFIACL